MQQAKHQNPALRPLQNRDDEALRALYMLSVRNNAGGFIQNLDHHGDIAARLREFKSGGGDALGLFDGEKLIGFGALKKTAAKKAELCKLHLHPDYHGQGLGRDLAQALIAAAKALKMECVELHVTITQETAISLYRKLGFTETGREVYVIGPESFDTLFMEMRIAA